MVTTEDFIKRLAVVMEYFNLSASAFADKVGVQRSGLSHLLSGRNKPSLDFIIKINESFPEVDLYWILFGQGDFPATYDGATQNPPTVVDPVTDTQIAPTESPITSPSPVQSVASNPHSDVEKIIIFYRDGSFSEYQPR